MLTESHVLSLIFEVGVTAGLERQCEHHDQGLEPGTEQGDPSNFSAQL